MPYWRRHATEGALISVAYAMVSHSLGPVMPGRTLQNRFTA